MAMLSELLRFNVVDGQDRRVRLDDLALAVLDDDYPPVTGIRFQRDGTKRGLDWDAVKQIGPGRRFVVDDLDAAPEVNDEAAGGDVLLRHDILDALIIDLLNRRTTRANDLELKQEDGILRLVAADASVSAMLRRISHGYYRHINKNQLYDWQYVEFLRGDPKAVENGEGYRLRIGRLPAGEIAQLADYVPYLHAAELLKLLPDDKAADVLQAMSVERQLQVVGELDNEEVAQLLERMSPDLAADLAGRLHMGRMRHVLGHMPKEKSDRIIELLRYPEDSVGGVMINNMVFFRSDASVAEAKEKVKGFLERTDFMSLIFLVDEERKLRGSVPLRELLAADDEVRLTDIMDPYIAALEPFGSARDAAYRIVGGQLAAMPVVEESGKLIGAMTVNAAIAQLLPASSSLRTLRVFS